MRLAGLNTQVAFWNSVNFESAFQPSRARSGIDSESSPLSEEDD